jgi:integrase
MATKRTKMTDSGLCPDHGRRGAASRPASGRGPPGQPHQRGQPQHDGCCGERGGCAARARRNGRHAALASRAVSTSSRGAAGAAAPDAGARDRQQGHGRGPAGPPRSSPLGNAFLRGLRERDRRAGRQNTSEATRRMRRARRRATSRVRHDRAAGIAHARARRLPGRLLVGCGLRRAEAVALDLDDYDQADGKLTVHGKGGVVRDVCRRNEVCDAVETWLRARGDADGALLRHVDRHGTIRGRLSTTAINKRVCRYVPATPHDFRRTYVGRALDAGTDLVTVQKLVGHKSPITTSRYDKTRRSRSRACGRTGAPAPLGGSADAHAPERERRPPRRCPGSRRWRPTSAPTSTTTATSGTSGEAMDSGRCYWSGPVALATHPAASRSSRIQAASASGMASSAARSAASATVSTGNQSRMARTASWAGVRVGTTSGLPRPGGPAPAGALCAYADVR